MSIHSDGAYFPLEWKEIQEGHVHFEVDNRCACGGKLAWIQCVRLFDEPDTLELTARCKTCMAMYDVRITLGENGD